MPDLPDRIEWNDETTESVTERVNRRIRDQMLTVGWGVSPLQIEDNAPWGATTATGHQHVIAGDVFDEVTNRNGWLTYHGLSSMAAGNTEGEQRMPRITTAIREAIMTGLKEQLVALIERIISEIPRQNRPNIDAALYARHYADSIWSSVISRHVEMRKSKYELGGWHKTALKRPADYEEVLVIEGALKFIACQHPDCAPDWFMLDGTRVDGRNTWWVRFPNSPEEG